MKTLLSMLVAAGVVLTAIPAVSVVTATGAHAWPKHKKCTRVNDGHPHLAKQDSKEEMR